GHNFHPLIPGHHFIGFDGEENQHKNTGQSLRITDKNTKMAVPIIPHPLKKLHHRPVIDTVSLDKGDGFFVLIRRQSPLRLGRPRQKEENQHSRYQCPIFFHRIASLFLIILSITFWSSVSSQRAGDPASIGTWLLRLLNSTTCCDKLI